LTANTIPQESTAGPGESGAEKSGGPGGTNSGRRRRRGGRNRNRRERDAGPAAGSAGDELGDEDGTLSEFPDTIPFAAREDAADEAIGHAKFDDDSEPHSNFGDVSSFAITPLIAGTHAASETTEPVVHEVPEPAAQPPEASDTAVPELHATPAPERDTWSAPPEPALGQEGALPTDPDLLPSGFGSAPEDVKTATEPKEPARPGSWGGNGPLPPAVASLDQLSSVLQAAGLELVQTDEAKLEFARQRALAATPPQVRVPRYRKSLPPVSSEPLVQIETRKH
jgi:ribonuclease E